MKDKKMSLSNDGLVVRESQTKRQTIPSLTLRDTCFVSCMIPLLPGVSVFCEDVCSKKRMSQVLPLLEGLKKREEDHLALSVERERERD